MNVKIVIFLLLLGLLSAFCSAGIFAQQAAVTELAFPVPEDWSQSMPDAPYDIAETAAGTVLPEPFYQPVAEASLDPEPIPFVTPTPAPVAAVQAVTPPAAARTPVTPAAPAQQAARPPVASTQTPTTAPAPSAQQPPPPAATQSVTPRIPVQQPLTPQYLLPEIQPEIAAPINAEENAGYSRTADAAAGQTVEIPFQGSGWVYLGEKQSRRGMSYLSRRQDTEGQSFIFRADEPGTYELKFYKQDFIRDYILNDVVQINVTPSPEVARFSAPVTQSRVIAEPRWPSTNASSDTAVPSGVQAAPQTPAQTENQTPAQAVSAAPQPVQTAPAARPAAAQTAPQNVSPPAGTTGYVPEATPAATAPVPAAAQSSANPVVPSNLSASDFMARALAAYNEKRYTDSLAILDQFRREYPSGSDEAFWLYGQNLEADSPSRDVRDALSYYRKLVDEYPLSARYNDARRRVTYLERFYFDIR
ncbi:hypothetical protein FACS1894151_05620 [Spirochaetia bacterium]|nr:hypothetical protein FACS1894151_05620 [Spirochaetia bacterium]